MDYTHFSNFIVFYDCGWSYTNISCYWRYWNRRNNVKNVILQTKKYKVMTNEQFIYWLKGYMAAQIDCQIKTDIEKTLAIVGIKPTSTLSA